LFKKHTVFVQNLYQVYLWYKALYKAIYRKDRFFKIPPLHSLRGDRAQARAWAKRRSAVCPTSAVRGTRQEPGAWEKKSEEEEKKLLPGQNNSN
jgi:hypothetical protein